LNISTFASDANYKTRTAFTGGAIVEYYFSDRWSMRTGLILDPMVAEDDFDNADQLNYLTLPLNANWHFGKNRNWYLNFGFGLSFLLSAEADLADGTVLDIKEILPSSDVGLMLGIGYKFDVSENIQLFIDYQGFGGFYNLDKEDVLPVDIRNSRSAFNLGLVFSLP
jgi:opacity protein-like surface antigen